MVDRRVFPYVVNRDYIDDGRARPLLPVILRYRHLRLEALARLDSGADLNVLPYRVGLQLGGNWNDQREVVGLRGIGTRLESRTLVVDLTLAHWPAISVSFAWANSDKVAIILGQATFFQHDEICFLHSPSQMRLDYRPKQYNV